MKEAIYAPTSGKRRLSTELRKSLRMWFGEVCYCCCLPLLPQIAYTILATTYKDFFSALYISLFTLSGGRHRMFSAYSNINAHKNYLGRREVTKGTIESVGDEYATL